MNDVDGYVAPSPPRRAVTGWVIYDLANVIFSTNILSLYFPLWIVDNAGGTDTHFALAGGISMMFVFFLAPIVGGISDRAPRRMPFLIASTLICCALTALLGLWGLYPSLAIFVLANTVFLLGLIFYDGLLPAVSTPSTRGRVSGYGIGAGFGGSLIGIALGLTVLSFGDDLKPQVFRLTALLFLIFSIPCFRWVQETVHAELAPQPPRAASAIDELRATVRDTANIPGLRRFLVGRACYGDAVNTLTLFLGIYATEEIGFSDFQTQLVLLVGILIGPLGALWSGRAADQRGPRWTLNVLLLLWMTSFALAALIPILDLPAWLFWGLAPLIGIALGGTSTTERAFLLRLSPPEMIGRVIGINAMVGRFAAIASPLLWVFVSTVLGLGRPAAVLSLVFIVAAARTILQRVPDDVPAQSLPAEPIALSAPGRS